MKKFTASLAGAIIMIMAASAMASPIVGSIWTYTTPLSQAAAGNLLLPANMPPASLIQATFTVDALNFDSGRGTMTYDSFLKGSTSSNVNNLVWTSGTTTFQNSFVTGADFIGSIFQFTGTYHFDANVTIRHDDGIYLTLMDLNGNLVKSVDSSYPTVAINTNLGNAAGDYKFVLKGYPLDSGDHNI
jgi:hypothetical protein